MKLVRFFTKLHSLSHGVARWPLVVTAYHVYGDREFSPCRCTVQCDIAQVVHTHTHRHLFLSPSSIIRCQRKLGGKQAHRATH